MSAFKNILFPFDSQIRSEQSFEQAIEIARQHKGNLIFLYTIRFDNARRSSATEIKKQMTEKSDKRLSEIEERYDLNSLKNYEFHTEIGFLASRVLLKIKEYPIDLLVVEKESLMELNAEPEKIDCPIVIVPD